jgi:hypothetical protein
MTEVSRLKIDHPTLGTVGGSALHTAVENGYIRIGDNMSSRFFTGNVTASGGTIDFDHNFQVPFDDLSVTLYKYVTGTGESTPIVSGGTPDLNDFDIEARSGFETTQIRVTNNSGSAEDISILIVQGAGSAGGGGGSGLIWNPVSGSAPVSDEEFNELVYLYENGLTQNLQVYLKVPDTYQVGKQVNLRLAHYSPSNSDTVLLRTVATLIRKNLDAMDTSTNTHTSTNTAVTNSVANRYREIVCDLTTASGQVNSVAVSPGDILKVVLTRQTDTDTADTRFVPSATEATFL